VEREGAECTVSGEMDREKTEMMMITDYEEKETRVQETCGVQVRKGGKYKIGQMLSTG
jgi:hypothetical protein